MLLPLSEPTDQPEVQAEQLVVQHVDPVDAVVGPEVVIVQPPILERPMVAVVVGGPPRQDEVAGNNRLNAVFQLGSDAK